MSVERESGRKGVLRCDGFTMPRQKRQAYWHPAQ
jgi:hypothetical protein